MFYWLNKINEDVKKEVGQKAADIGKLYFQEFEVPLGFVVSAEVYDVFIRESGLLPVIENMFSKIVADPESLQDYANEIQKAIVNSELPSDIKDDLIDNYETLDIDTAVKDAIKQVGLTRVDSDISASVRSSIVMEDGPMFKGKTAVLLNAKGKTDIVRAVKTCWASLFTAAAISHRMDNNLDMMDLKSAIIIQRMLFPKKSGVLYTINPYQDDPAYCTIRAGYGLGEAIASGHVNANEYVVRKDTLDIADSITSNQEWKFIVDARGKIRKENLTNLEMETQVLKEKEIISIAKVAKKIALHFNSPQEVEWAIDGDKLYLLHTKDINMKKFDFKGNIADAVVSAEALNEVVSDKVADMIINEAAATEEKEMATVKLEDNPYDILDIDQIPTKTDEVYEEHPSDDPVEAVPVHAIEEVSEPVPMATANASETDVPAESAMPMGGMNIFDQVTTPSVSSSELSAQTDSLESSSEQQTMTESMPMSKVIVEDTVEDPVEDIEAEKELTEMSQRIAEISRSINPPKKGLPDPDFYLKKAKHSFGNSVVTCDIAINAALKNKFFAKFGGENIPQEIHSLLAHLHDDIGVELVERIKNIRNIRDRYLEWGHEITPDEMATVLNMTEEIVENLR